jgi:hypothetical protein
MSQDVARHVPCTQVSSSRTGRAAPEASLSRSAAGWHSLRRSARWTRRSCQPAASRTADKVAATAHEL